MEPENLNQEEFAVEQKSSMYQVTPLSKYLALALFIILPFLGGYVGYTLAPAKVVEVEKIVYQKNSETQPVSTDSESVAITPSETTGVQQNNFIGNPEYVPVREFKKNAFVLDITSTTITLDEVELSEFEIVNERINPVTYPLNDTHLLTSARGPVTLETIQTNPALVSARLNDLNQPLAVIEFVTYKSSSGELIDVVTVVELSFSP